MPHDTSLSFSPPSSESSSPLALLPPSLSSPLACVVLLCCLGGLISSIAPTGLAGTVSAGPPPPLRRCDCPSSHLPFSPSPFPSPLHFLPPSPSLPFLISLFASQDVVPEDAIFHFISSTTKKRAKCPRLPKKARFHIAHSFSVFAILPPAHLSLLPRALCLSISSQHPTAPTRERPACALIPGPPRLCLSCHVFFFPLVLSLLSLAIRPCPFPTWPALCFLAPHRRRPC